MLTLSFHGMVPAPTANYPSALCLSHTPSHPHFLFPSHPCPPTPHSLPSTGIQKVHIIPPRGRKREAGPPLSERQGASISNIFSWLSLGEKCPLKKRCLLSSRECTERDGSLNASLQSGDGAEPRASWARKTHIVLMLTKCLIHR